MNDDPLHARDGLRRRGFNALLTASVFPWPNAAGAADRPSCLEAAVAALGNGVDGLRPLAATIIGAVAPRAWPAIVAGAEARARLCIGDAVASARASLPALTDDDFDAGRVVDVDGVCFSHTELAVLFVVHRGS